MKVSSHKYWILCACS